MQSLDFCEFPEQLCPLLYEHLVTQVSADYIWLYIHTGKSLYAIMNTRFLSSEVNIVIADKLYDING